VISKVLRGLLLSLFGAVMLTMFASNSASASSNPSAESKSNDGKVVIVSLPRVTWQSLADSDTPNIDKLIADGSIASFSVKTASAISTTESSYASISAGIRAAAVDPSISTFYSASEMVGSRNAADIFKRERGKTPSDSQSVAIGFERTISKNSSGLSPATVGAFADSLASRNKTIAVFGNADHCQKMVPSCTQRSIGYLGTSQEGIFSYGDVSRNLLNDDLTMNMEKLESSSIQSLKENDVTAVECSDLEKLEKQRELFTVSQFDSAFSRSIKECDKLIGNLVSNLDLSKDRIYVLSPVPPAGQNQLTMFVSAGKGIEPGYASSGITRREGIVALGDIAPTILTFYGITPPTSMVTTLIETKPSSDSVLTKENKMVEMNERALARDSSFAMVAAVFGLLSFSSILISILAIRKFRSFRTIAKWMALTLISFPAVTFLILPLMESLPNSISIVALLFVVSLLFAAVGFYFGERDGYLFVVLGFVGLNIVLLVVDVLTGAQLQLNSYFGYSAIVAGRYAGYGNMAFAILSISSVIAVAVVKQLGSTNKSLDKNWINHSLFGFLILILVLDGAPFFGSDVGGVLALTPTVFVISMMLYGKKLGVRSIFSSALLTFAAIAVFAIVDLNRPIAERTHLGRFVEVLFNGQAGIVIERKIASNLAILTNSTISSVVIIGTLVGMFLFFHPERFIKELINQYPFFKFLVLPGLVLAGLGLLLNDSGVAIPGMMLSIALPASALVLYDFEPLEQTLESNTTLQSKKV
jgi:hypothetical protein